MSKVIVGFNWFAGEKAVISSARGFVHPILAKGNPEEVAEFVKAYSPKK